MKLSVNIRKNSLIILILTSLFSIHLSAQCIDYAQKVCKDKLGKFVHDGNYNAIPLSNGESAELYKTFFSRNDYRIAVCQQGHSKNIQIQIVDEDDQVLFDNKLHQLTDTWDFSVETTQMLIIKLKVLDSDNLADDSQSCVAVLFGIH